MCKRITLDESYTRNMTIYHMYLEKNSPIKLFNNNTACMCWSKSTTTKGLLHITIQNKDIIDIPEAKIYTSNLIATTNNALKFQDTTLSSWIK